MKAAVAANAAGSAAFPPADPAAVERWQSNRFGMFIHWGPVSLTGQEIGWSRGAGVPIAVYDNLYKKFNPTNFDADAWVSLAKAAGMKYIVLTTKHHDGFCMWDTKLTDYNIMHTPFHRDVVKELAAACKKQGIAFGAYYSVPDWYDKDWPMTSPGGSVKRETSNMDAYEKYLQGQITELIKNYGPLITIWNDIPQPYGERGLATIKLVRSLQPDILINNRTGAGGDYDTPEQRIGKFQLNRPWESCMTVSAHNQWAWGGAADGVKPLSACVKMVVLAAGGDGNVLLNVGPRPDGIIDPAQANLLKAVGQWFAKNGESIYGTRGGPWKPTKSFASTRKGNVIYLHLLAGQPDTIELPDLPVKIESARILGGDEIKVLEAGGKLTLTVPANQRQANDTIVKLQINGAVMDLPILEMAPLNKATASNVFQHDTADYGAPEAFDGDEGTRWATDNGTQQAWIAAEFPALKTVTQVKICEAFAGRVQKFEFQYRDGDGWKTIFSGTTLGEHFQKSFSAVTAKEFRLNILAATEGPTINEIVL